MHTLFICGDAAKAAGKLLLAVSSSDYGLSQLLDVFWYVPRRRRRKEQRRRQCQGCNA